jgi:hypothetical protein
LFLGLWQLGYWGRRLSRLQEPEQPEPEQQEPLTLVQMSLLELE